MQDCKYEGQFDRVLEKLDKTDETLAKINDNLLRNTISLENHMARTTQIEQLVLPMHKVYTWGAVSFKVLGLVAVIISIIKYL